MDKLGSVARLIGVGFFIVACILGGVLGGLWLDKTFNTRPIFLLIGLILGLVVAFWGVYQMLIPIINEDKKDRK
jgi:F0F1-type ATP synthase assembly protein I